MPHNPTAINPWTTAQEFNSGEAATSTQYNQVVNNLSLMYARPYITVVNTVSQTLSNGNAIFTGGSPTTITNSPASLAGSISFSTNTLTVPLSGLYRLTMNIGTSSSSTNATFGMQATFAGGTAANNHTFNTPRIANSSTVATYTSASFLIQMNATSGGTYPNSVSFVALTSASLSFVGNALPIAGSTTFVQLEYLGASLGSI